MSQTIVAVDIGGTKIACGLVTLGGEKPVISKVEKVPTDAMAGGEHVLATVLAQIKAAVEGGLLERAEEVGRTELAAAGVEGDRHPGAHRVSGRRGRGDADRPLAGDGRDRRSRRTSPPAARPP